MTSLLGLQGALAVVAAWIYFYVAGVVVGRSVEKEEARRANRAFATFWYCLGGLAVLDAARILLGYTGIVDVELHATLRMLTVPLTTLLLGSLLYYLTFLHTGDPRWMGPIAVLHVALFVVYTYLAIWTRPIGVEVTAWRVHLLNGRELEGALRLAVVIPLLAPVLVAAGAYLLLYFKVREREARLRIALISVAFLVWSGANLFANATGFARQHEWWPLAVRILGLAAALLVILAFVLPERMRRALAIAEQQR